MKKPTMKEVKDWTVEHADIIAFGALGATLGAVSYALGYNDGIKKFGKEFVKWRNIGAIVTLHPRTGEPLPLVPWCDVMEKTKI